MDKLSALVNTLPDSLKSYQTRQNIEINCSFGVPANATSIGHSLHTLDSNTNGFEFLMGEQSLPLLQAYAETNFPAQTERLVIGNNTCNETLDRRDYRALITSVSAVEFPRLKQLHIGSYFLLVNGAGATGLLGDVTQLLAHAPAVQDLSLVGNFTLTHSLNFTQLTELTVELDDYNSSLNRGPISDETLALLLSSEFPTLEEMFLDLSIDADTDYSLPNEFLAGRSCPTLMKLEITGQFREDILAKLAASPLCQREGFKLAIETD